MWSRRDLKARGKAAFKANYWKCVLVALILAVLSGSYAGSSVRKSQDEPASVEIQQALAELEELGDSPLAESLRTAMRKTAARRSFPFTIALGSLGAVGLVLARLRAKKGLKGDGLPDHGVENVADLNDGFNRARYMDRDEEKKDN